MQVEESTYAKDGVQGSDQEADQCKTPIEVQNNVKEEIKGEDKRTNHK